MEVEQNWKSVTRNISTSIFFPAHNRAPCENQKQRRKMGQVEEARGQGVRDRSESEQLQTRYVKMMIAQGEIWGGQKKHYLLSALSISMVTKTDRAIVMGSGALKMLQSTPLNILGSAGHCMW